MPTSLTEGQKGKLKPRFYEPYKKGKLNKVKVHLHLPPRACMHDVFHVGVLKPFVGSSPELPPMLPLIHNGAVASAPKKPLLVRLFFFLTGNTARALPSSVNFIKLKKYLQSYRETIE